MSALTVFVRNLPASASSEHLEEIFSEVGPVKRCFVVKAKGSEKCRGIGYVTYSMAEDAQRALREIKEYDGQKISIIQAKKKLNDKKQGKSKKAEKEIESPREPTESKHEQNSKVMRKKKMKARLIIRNLSFKCSEADLKEVFSKYGTVLDVHIPLKPDGKKRGFAFVQYKNMLEAGKALAATNLKEIKERKVAVDWAVSKDKFVANQPTECKKDEHVNSKEAEAGDEDDDDDDDEDDDDAPQKRSRVEMDHYSESEEHSASDDDDDEEEEDSEGEENEKDHDSESQDADSDGSMPTSEDNDDDDDDKNAKKKKKNPHPSDVSEGRTVFIRNLSFDSEEEGIEEVLLQFGELSYVRLVVHPETGLSKGCAFAQFKSKEAAEKCLAAAQDESETGGVRIDGRKLNITVAVSREDAVKLKSKKTKTHKGSRNLYLAREGLIRAGTKAAEGVSDSDMAKRTRFEELKRAKLKDVNVFVSKTRLCIHNLPKSVDRRRLLQLCLTAAGGGKGVRIKECHVMYDKKPVRGEPTGHSLGYGFVEFQEHEHALQALRHLNNNPTIFSPIKRPIVEFSLEDMRKLKIKAMRQEKSRAKPAAHSGAEKRQVHTVGNQKEGRRLPQEKPPIKGKAAPQQDGSDKVIGKNQFGHYSGFRTTPEVEHVELQDGKKRQKVLPMPSHRGPKIRNRDKGKQVVPVKKMKTIPSRKERNVVHTVEKPIQNKKQIAKPVKKLKSKEDDHFDRLVDQYKKKLTGTSSSKGSLVKKSKWFS